MKFLCLLFSVFLLFLLSCTPQRATINNYLENTTDTSGKDSVPIKPQVIQKNDLLAIKVYSNAIGSSPETDAPYNLVDQGTGAGGFLVDINGNIEYPQIGVLHVEGLTKEELAETIRKRFETELQNPSVVVRFTSYRITVLGEVGGPSTFTVPTERITILEALGLAGDITEFGSKNNVKVIRERNGHREIGTIDLTSKDMFLSPYFRLQQNDVVLVEQTRRKVKQQEQQMLVQQIGIASSIITAIALVLNLIQ
ncbi:MAG: polysaccharide biosynthesis/export family protein [Flavisolibacter sp.]|jgi:polysaccharide export outer membrane protein